MRVVDFTAGLNFHDVDALLRIGDVGASRRHDGHRDSSKMCGDRGDLAVCEYTKRFDEFNLTPELMRVPPEEIEKYAADADDELVDILRRAAKNIREFHEQQMENRGSTTPGDGVRLGVRRRRFRAPESIFLAERLHIRHRC